MREIAEKYGFTFSRWGCPCSGKPMYMNLNNARGRFELMVIERRQIWKLAMNNTTVANGSSADFEQRMKELKRLWD